MLKRSLFIIITLCFFPLVVLAQEFPWGRVGKEQIEDVFLRNDSADVLESATASLVISATDPGSSTQALFILKHAGVPILSASANGCLALNHELILSGATPTLTLDKTGEQGLINFYSESSLKFQIQHDTDDDLQILRHSGNWTVPLEIDYQNGDILIDPNDVGKVSIGTPTPDAKLSVFCDGGSSPDPAVVHFRQTSNNGALSDSNCMIHLSHSNGVNSRDWYLGTGSNTYWGHPDYFGIRDGVNPRMVITTAGNVGIGTISPSQRLEVKGQTNSWGGMLFNNIAGTAGLYASSSGAGYFKVNSGKDLYLSDGSNNLILKGGSGDVGIGTTSPNGKLDIDGEFVIRKMSIPGPIANAGILYASESYGVTEVFAKGSDGGYQQLSNHGDSGYFEFDPEDPLPWIYRGGNALLGKGVDANLSQLFRDLENLLGKKYLFYYDLPESERIDPEAWVLSQKRRLALEQKPEEEISFSEAWEVAEILEEATRMMTKTIYEPDFGSGQVLPSTQEIVVSCLKGTGRYHRQFKLDVRFDESTGKCFRSRTEDDLTTEELESIQVNLPRYLTDRLVKESGRVSVE